MRSCFISSQSSEGERKGANARIQEFYFECMIGDGAALPDKLVEAISGDEAAPRPMASERAILILLDIKSVSLSVDGLGGDRRAARPPSNK
jgi:hypothetical protein